MLEAFLFGTARTGGLLRAQPKENLERIEQAVREVALDRFKADVENSIEIPMPAMIYTGTKH